MVIDDTENSMFLRHFFTCLVLACQHDGLIYVYHLLCTLKKSLPDFICFTLVFGLSSYLCILSLDYQCDQTLSSINIFFWIVIKFDSFLILFLLSIFFPNSSKLKKVDWFRDPFFHLIHQNIQSIVLKTYFQRFTVSKCNWLTHSTVRSWMTAQIPPSKRWLVVW